MAWDDDKFIFRHGVKEEDWGGEDIAQASRGLPLVEWCGDIKDRSAARVGIEYLGGQFGIRTKHIANDGLMRTRGGHPQVTYEPKKDDNYPTIPEFLHGLIIDDDLFLYDEYSNTPTGQVLKLHSTSAGWGITQNASHYRNGHTWYVKGLEIDQNPTDFGPAIANSVASGDSLLYGLWKGHTTKEMGSPIGTYAAYTSVNAAGGTNWLYQAPSGSKYAMKLSFMVPNQGTQSGYRRSYGQSWTVYTTLEATRIFGDGTLGTPITIFENVTFTVQNTHTSYYYLEWDNYIRDGNYSGVQPFEGLNPSPTGNEVILNWLVERGPTEKVKYCAKSMRLTITESGGNLSASWATDLSEAQCRVLAADINDPGPEGLSQYQRWVENGHATWTVYGTGDPVNTSSGTARQAHSETFLLIRGFEPSAETNTVTGLWYRYSYDNISTTASSQTVTGEQFLQPGNIWTGDDMVWSATSTSSYERYTSYAILKDGTVVLDLRVEQNSNGDTTSSTTDTWHCVNGSPTESVVTSTDYSIGTIETIAVVNGERSVISGYSIDYNQNTPQETYYGMFVSNTIEGVKIDTNNCVSLSILGYHHVSDYPTGSGWGIYEPVYRKTIAAGLGNNGDNPSAKDFGWRFYVDQGGTQETGLDHYVDYVDRISWNPRRPMLFGIVSSAARPSDSPPVSRVWRSVAWI